MRYAAIVLMSWLLLSGIAIACSFKTAPVALERYYRESGWAIPGLSDAKLSILHKDVVDGLTYREITHPTPYLAKVPSQEFEQGQKRGRMTDQLMQIEDMARYEYEGRIVAYSYRFTPASGHLAGKKWVVDSEAACEFFATYIDEKGDGIFRLLVTDEMRTEFIPQWARKPKS